jgi:hypothetical protein
MKSTEKNQKKVKVFTDHNGNEIPANYIHKIDKEKHAAAQKLCTKAEDLSTRLKSLKDEMFSICDAFHERMLADNNVTVRVNSKGGYSIQTIDKAIKVVITVAETIHFNDKIEVAQAKIQEYLEKIMQGANTDLQLLVNRAFKTSKGRLDTKQIIGLFQLNITHETWKEAMELIKQSMTTNSTKRYVQVWKRKENGEYEAVKLDFASL